jgi:hypothetical protein
MSSVKLAYTLTKVKIKVFKPLYFFDKFFFLALEVGSEAGRQQSSLSVSDFYRCCAVLRFRDVYPNPIFSIHDPESKRSRIRIKAFKYF